MKIKCEGSHIIDMSGTVLFSLAPAPPEAGGPYGFPLASGEKDLAGLSAGVLPVNLWLVCAVHFWGDGLAQSPVAVTSWL